MSETKSNNIRFTIRSQSFRNETATIRALKQEIDFSRKNCAQVFISPFWQKVLTVKAILGYPLALK